MAQQEYEGNNEFEAEILSASGELFDAVVSFAAQNERRVDSIMELRHTLSVTAQIQDITYVHYWDVQIQPFFLEQTSGKPTALTILFTDTHVPAQKAHFAAKCLWYDDSPLATGYELRPNPNMMVDDVHIVSVLQHIASSLRGDNPHPAIYREE